MTDTTGHATGHTNFAQGLEKVDGVKVLQLRHQHQRRVTTQKMSKMRQQVTLMANEWWWHRKWRKHCVKPHGYLQSQHARGKNEAMISVWRQMAGLQLPSGVTVKSQGTHHLMLAGMPGMYWLSCIYLYSLTQALICTHTCVYHGWDNNNMLQQEVSTHLAPAHTLMH